MTLRRIVAGGQTGVDRGALDAALAAGVSCGGWCPAGRRAEDGVIPAQYLLRETESTGYAERTRRNVQDSDGTLVVTFGPATGGTALTVQQCGRLGRPALVVDATSVAGADAADMAARFVREHALRVLNVAGPRASEAPDASRYAYAVIEMLLAASQADSRNSPVSADSDSSGAEQAAPRQR